MVNPWVKSNSVKKLSLQQESSEVHGPETEGTEDFLAPCNYQDTQTLKNYNIK